MSFGEFVVRLQKISLSIAVLNFLVYIFIYKRYPEWMGVDFLTHNYITDTVAFLLASFGGALFFNLFIVVAYFIHGLHAVVIVIFFFLVYPIVYTYNNGFALYSFQFSLMTTVFFLVIFSKLLFFLRRKGKIKFD